MCFLRPTRFWGVFFNHRDNLSCSSYRLLLWILQKWLSRQNSLESRLPWTSEGRERGKGFLSPVITSRQMSAASGILARLSQSLTSGHYRNNVFHEELLVKKFPLTLRVQQSVVYKPSNSLGWASQAGKNYNFWVALHSVCSVVIL